MLSAEAMPTKDFSHDSEETLFEGELDLISNGRENMKTVNALNPPGPTPARARDADEFSHFK